MILQQGVKLLDSIKKRVTRPTRRQSQPHRVETLDRKRLQAILNYLDVPESLYKLSDEFHCETCITIEHTRTGWEVYRTGSDGKFDAEIFDNETDACLNMLSRVLHK